MAGSYKFGRTPATHNRRTMRSAVALARHLDPLGRRPVASNDYVAAVMAGSPGGWQMLGNDSVGDCVQACAAHYLMLRTANTGQIVIPNDNDVLALYSAETGYNPADPYTDQGTNETEDADYMVSTGFLGHKAEVTAAVDPGNLDHIGWCTQLFGACELGIYVTEGMMREFDAGQPWTGSAAHSQVLGGHSVPIVHYDQRYFYCVTWGKLHPIEPALMKNTKHFLEEAHTFLYPDWITSQGLSPSKLNLAQLETDLKEVAA